MELRISSVNPDVSCEVLSEACSLADCCGVRADSKDVILTYESEDEVWQVWRELKLIKEGAVGKKDSTTVEVCQQLQEELSSKVKSNRKSIEGWSN